MPDDPTNPAGGGSADGGAGDKTAGAGDQAPPDPAAELEAERSRAAAAEARAAKAERDLDVARAGLTDPDAADLVEHFYSRLPEKDRPSRGDWLRSLTPATAPKGLVPYLPAAPAPAAAEGKPPVPPPAAGKTTVASPGSPPASAGAAGAATTVTAAELRSARIEAQRTGNFTKVRELLSRVDPRVKPAKS